MNEVVATPLLEKRAEVGCLDEREWTATHRAAMSRHKNMIKLLLDKDALLFFRAFSTEQLWVAMDGHEVVVKPLLGEGVDIAIENDSQRIALYWAVLGGHEAVVKPLWKTGLTPPLATTPR